MFFRKAEPKENCPTCLGELLGNNRKLEKIMWKKCAFNV
jgi:hypothetical protein